jgi:hypothetical protein
MVGPHCHFFHTTNISGTQFCSSCNKPVTELSYQKVMQGSEETKIEFRELKRQQENNNSQLQRVIRFLGELISKSDSLDFKDIKWPLLDVMDYYEDNKGDGVGLSVTRDILKIREERMKERMSSSSSSNKKSKCF